MERNYSELYIKWIKYLKDIKVYGTFMYYLKNSYNLHYRLQTLKGIKTFVDLKEWLMYNQLILIKIDVMSIYLDFRHLNEKKESKPFGSRKLSRKLSRTNNKESYTYKEYREKEPMPWLGTKNRTLNYRKI